MWGKPKARVGKGGGGFARRGKPMTGRERRGGFRRISWGRGVGRFLGQKGRGSFVATKN